MSLTELWQEQEQEQGGLSSAPCNPVTVCTCRGGMKKEKGEKIEKRKFRIFCTIEKYS